MPPALRPARIAVPVGRIKLRERLRPSTPSAVEAMKVSLVENGQLQPVLVRPIGEDDDGFVYELVIGLHRLEAAQGLGWPRLECFVREMSDDEALQAEIDENLVRKELSPLDRAIFVEARLAVWARRFPDRVNGGEGNSANMTELKPKRGRPSGNSATIAEFQPGMGFTAETAQDLGLSVRTVRNALAIVRGLALPVRRLLADTWVADNEGVLRELAGIGDRDEQIAVATLLAEGKTKSVSDARALAAGRAPQRKAVPSAEATADAFRKLWKGASPTARAAMMTWLAGQPLPAGWSVQKAKKGRTDA